MKENFLAILIPIGAYGFFVVCPRMAAMTNIISKNFGFSIYLLVILGTILSIPLLIIMTWIIRKYGIIGGLGFAVFTDILASLLLSFVNIKVAVETFIIAIFVVMGSKIATWITSYF